MISHTWQVYGVLAVHLLQGCGTKSPTWTVSACRLRLCMWPLQGHTRRTRAAQCRAGSCSTTCGACRRPGAEICTPLCCVGCACKPDLSTACHQLPAMGLTCSNVSAMYNALPLVLVADPETWRLAASGGTGTGCGRTSRGTASATASWWRPCPPPPPRRCFRPLPLPLSPAASAADVAAFRMCGRSVLAANCCLKTSPADQELAYDAGCDAI
jgi:hypothetical protein